MANIWKPNWQPANIEKDEDLEFYKPEVMIDVTWTMKSSELGMAWRIEVSDDWLAEYGSKKVCFNIEHDNDAFQDDYTFNYSKNIIQCGAIASAGIDDKRISIKLYVPKRFFLLGHCDFQISHDFGNTWQTVTNHNQPPQQPLPSGKWFWKFMKLIPGWQSME